MDAIDRVLRSNLKLRHLRLLVALDEYRHLGRASEFLALTQPAVSRTLAEIERAFDLALFVRSPRGTEPTPHGETVVRFARSVLADFGRTRDELAAVSAGAAGRTAIGAMAVAVPGLVSRAVERMKARSAQTTVSVEEGDLSRLLPRLRLGELDLFVGRLEPGYSAPDLEPEPLLDEPMCLVVAPGHPLAGRTRLRWRELAAQRWVMPPPWAASRDKLQQLFWRDGVEPPVDLVESASFLVALTFVRERGAIAFWARGVARAHERLGLVTRLRIEVSIELPPVGTIAIRGRRRTPAAERMAACLREAATAIARGR